MQRKTRPHASSSTGMKLKERSSWRDELRVGEHEADIRSAKRGSSVSNFNENPARLVPDKSIVG